MQIVLKFIKSIEKIFQQYNKKNMCIKLNLKIKDNRQRFILLMLYQKKTKKTTTENFQFEFHLQIKPIF